MLIVDIPEEGDGETIFQSWWRFPEIMGYEKGTPEYEALQRMWEERTGKRIPREEREDGEEEKADEG